MGSNLCLSADLVYVNREGGIYRFGWLQPLARAWLPTGANLSIRGLFKPKKRDREGRPVGEETGRCDFGTSQLRRRPETSDPFCEPVLNGSKVSRYESLQ